MSAALAPRALPPAPFGAGMVGAPVTLGPAMHMHAHACIRPISPSPSPPPALPPSPTAAPGSPPRSPPTLPARPAPVFFPVAAVAVLSRASAPRSPTTGAAAAPPASPDARNAAPSPPLPSLPPLRPAAAADPSQSDGCAVPVGPTGAQTTAYRLVRDFLAIRSHALAHANANVSANQSTASPAPTTVAAAMSGDSKRAVVPKLFVARRNAPGTKHKSTRLCALLGSYSLPPSPNAAVQFIESIPCTADWIGSLKLLAAARPADALVIRAAAAEIAQRMSFGAAAAPAAAAAAVGPKAAIRFRVTVEVGDVVQHAASLPARPRAHNPLGSDSDSSDDEDGGARDELIPAAANAGGAAVPNANADASVLAPALIAKRLARAVPAALGPRWIGDVNDSSVELYLSITDSTEVTCGLTLAQANTQKIVSQLQADAQCDLLSVCRLAGDVSALNVLYGQLLRAPAFGKTILNKTNQTGESAVLQAVRERDSAAVSALCSLGARINNPDNRGLNAVMVAAANGDHTCLEPLLRVKGISNKTFRQALVLATQHAHTHIVRLLLQYMSRVVNLSIRRESEDALLVSAETGSSLLTALLLDADHTLRARYKPTKQPVQLAPPPAAALARSPHVATAAAATAAACESSACESVPIGVAPPPLSVAMAASAADGTAGAVAVASQLHVPAGTFDAGPKAHPQPQPQQQPLAQAQAQTDDANAKAEEQREREAADRKRERDRERDRKRNADRPAYAPAQAQAQSVTELKRPAFAAERPAHCAGASASAAAVFSGSAAALAGDSAGVVTLSLAASASTDVKSAPALSVALPEAQTHTHTQAQVQVQVQVSAKKSAFREALFRAHTSVLTVLIQTGVQPQDELVPTDLPVLRAPQRTALRHAMRKGAQLRLKPLPPSLYVQEKKRLRQFVAACLQPLPDELTPIVIAYLCC